MSYDSGFLPFSSKDPGQIVEIFFKNSEIYSAAPPPALLHVNSSSRNFVLKLYKPWLPQFKGTPEYEPWEEIIQTHGLEKASKLQNVCFDLARDILFWKSNYGGSPLGQFGYIEYQNVQSICVDITEESSESLDTPTTPNLVKDLCAFKQLSLLRLYETTGSGANRTKVRKIKETLSVEKLNSRGSPKVNDEWTELAFPALPSAWTTYKYTTSYLRPKPQPEQRTWTRPLVAERKVEIDSTSSQPDGRVDTTRRGSNRKSIQRPITGDHRGGSNRGEGSGGGHILRTSLTPIARPPVIQIDYDLLQQYRDNMISCGPYPLPDEDDADL